jgi:hypothetical protein
MTCEECNRKNGNHTVFCSEAEKLQRIMFLKFEMWSSLKKLWENERDFKEITDFYVNDPNLQHLPEVDRKARAAQSAARKLAGANCTYYMSRATMFATALNAEKTQMPPV